MMFSYRQMSTTLDELKFH